MKNEKGISNAILVKDNSVRNILESKLYIFLKAQGFSLWAVRNYPTCNWIYVSLNDKTYMPGMPGIGITSVLGGHAVTVEEFYVIYEMFKKYKNSEILCMTKEEAIIKKMRQNVADAKREEYFKDLSYEEYLSRSKQFVIEIVGKNEPEKYIDAFMKEEDRMFRTLFNSYAYPNAHGYEISLMYDRIEPEEQNETATKEPERIVSSEIIDSVYLVSQTMNVCLELFGGTIQENERTFYKYKFIAEDEFTAQCIDFEDTVGYLQVAQLCLALSGKSYEKEQIESFSWGRLKFMPWWCDEKQYLTVSIYPEDVPKKNKSADRCNYFCMELDEEEIEKFKSFLLNLYRKMHEAEV